MACRTPCGRRLVIDLRLVAGDADRARIRGTLLVRRVAPGAVGVLADAVETLALVGRVAARARRWLRDALGAVRAMAGRAPDRAMVALRLGCVTARAGRRLLRRVRIVADRARAVPL